MKFVIPAHAGIYNNQYWIPGLPSVDEGVAPGMTVL